MIRLLAAVFLFTLSSPAGDTLLSSTTRSFEEFGVVEMVTVDPSGSIVVVGHTRSADLPVTNGSTLTGDDDGFFVRLDATGERVLLASYFGGAAFDTLQEVAFEADGDLLVLGITDPFQSPDPAIFRQSTPGYPAPPATFVARFDSDFQLVEAGYVSRLSRSLTVAPDGGIFTRHLDDGCRIEKLAPDLRTRTLFAVAPDRCTDLAVNRNGDVLVAGFTGNASVPVTLDALQPEPLGPRNGFLVKLDRAGALRYATYLGGSYTAPDPDLRIDGAGFTQIELVTVDRDDNIILVGTTATTDFPTTPGAIQRELRANCSYPSHSFVAGSFPVTQYFMDDIFVTKLNPTGTEILASTLLGGDCYEEPSSVLAALDGDVWISGRTQSNPFPQASPFHAGPEIGQYAGFVARISGDTTELALSSYLPSANGSTLSRDNGGDVWVAASGFAGRFGEAPLNPLWVTSAGNLFSRRNGPVTPGAYTLVTADGLDEVEWVHLGWAPSQPPPRELAGIEVLFDGAPAAIYAAGPGYVECIAPDSIAAMRSTMVQVVYRGVASEALRVDVKPVNLALLAADFSGAGRANARHTDGTLNTPDNPAAPGETVYFFFTGAGSASGCADGTIAGGGSPAPIIETNYGTSHQSYPVPGFLCGIYYFAFPAPENWETRLDAPIQILITDNNQVVSASQTLTFSVAKSVALAARGRARLESTASVEEDSP